MANLFWNNVFLQQLVCSDNKIQSILKKYTENKELLVFTLCFYINRNKDQENSHFKNGSMLKKAVF